MIYLTGVSNDYTQAAAQHELYGKLGFLMQPGTTHHAPHIENYSAWAMDNGCFSNAGEFDETAFLATLERTVNEVPNAYDSCLFAVAPDVFDPVAMKGKPVETIERSLPVFEKIRAIGVPVALVLQDGLENLLPIIPWDSFDVAFVGGGDAFKMGYPSSVSAGRPGYELGDDGATCCRTRAWARLIAEVHAHDKGLHVGRVNSMARLAFACEIGADSADGTFIKFGGQKNLARLAGWVSNMETAGFAMGV